MDALWEQVTQLHGANEAAHTGLHTRINTIEMSVTANEARLTNQEANAGTIRQQGDQVASSVAQLQAQVQGLQAQATSVDATSAATADRQHQCGRYLGSRCHSCRHRHEQRLRSRSQYKYQYQYHCSDSHDQ